MYEEVAAAKLNAKLASNPQYGHVGGGGGGGGGGGKDGVGGGGGGGGGGGVAAENPQYGATTVALPEAPQNNEHMYASLKEPSSVLSGEVKAPTPYSQPYAHVPGPVVPGPVVPIPTENNVAYSSPTSQSP